MNKKWVIVGCFICCILLFGGGILFQLSQPQQKTNDVMQLTIFPTGSSEETYYFELSQEGVLACTVGERKSNNIKQSNFLKKVVYSSERNLTVSDSHILIDMLNELAVSGYSSEKPLVDDSWDVVLLYNGKVYEMNYSHWNDSLIFTKLTNKIIELSPIPVDLHSWS